LITAIERIRKDVDTKTRHEIKRHNNTKHNNNGYQMISKEIQSKLDYNRAILDDYKSKLKDAKNTPDFRAIDYYLAHIRAVEKAISMLHAQSRQANNNLYKEYL
jgi:DNA-binding ferritin-like protein